MNSPLFLFFLLPISAHSASGGGFDGCQGLKVTRSRDFSQVDVSADLLKAQKRIDDLCKNVIPKKMKIIDASAKSCVSGAAIDTGSGIAGQIVSQTRSQLYAFAQRVKEACESMKEAIADSKQFCEVRKITLAQVNQQIESISKAESDQASSQGKAAALYGVAVDAHRSTANAAAKAKNRIYASLPDKDESRSEQMRKGNESASTRDPKSDKLIGDWKATLTNLAVGNKKKSACAKLAVKGGLLDDMGDILKNNLWPNGKVAARAISRVESVDQQKASDLAMMKSEAERRLAASKIAEAEPVKAAVVSDISGTEEKSKLTSNTQPQIGEINRKAQEGANLQRAAADICQKQGGCQSEEAVWSAIKEAEAKESGPKLNIVPSPARESANGNFVSEPQGQAGILDDFDRAPASAPSENYKAPDVPCITSVWGWWPPGYTKAIGVKDASGACIAN